MKLYPRVSVIIPTKNRAHYVSLAIQSVLNQTFRDFEILVVDGASADNTKEVISEFDDPRIHYIRQKNDRGVSAARNLGIIRSRGEFIAFLDDDDLWMPRTLEKQFGLLNRKPWIGAVTSSCFLIRKDGRLLGFWRPSMRGNIYPKILEGNRIGNCSGVMVRRSCFDAVGLFDENLRAGEDWDMWIRLAKKCEFDKIDEPMFLYRIHEKRLSRNPYLKLQAARLIFDKFLPDTNLSANRTEALKRWHFRFGQLYLEYGDKRRAKEEFTKAINMDPYFLSSYLHLFLSFFGTKSYDISRKILESARLVNPN